MSVPVAALTLLAVAAAPAAGWAQGNPSADQIIRSLRPTGAMSGGTRGIRPAAPTMPPAQTEATPAGLPSATPAARRLTPATAASPPVAPAVVGAGGGAPSVNLNVQFRTNSAELTPAAVHTLDQLGRALSSQALSSYRFRIEGHTDTVGSPEANKALSERRAQAVVDYLASKYNVDRSRLDAVGMGEDGLLVQTPGQTPDARNRRVQVVNVGA